MKVLCIKNLYKKELLSLLLRRIPSPMAMAAAPQF
jgi:hypothetical protein